MKTLPCSHRVPTVFRTRGQKACGDRVPVFPPLRGTRSTPHPCGTGSQLLKWNRVPAEREPVHVSQAIDRAVATISRDLSGHRIQKPNTL